MSFAPKDEHEAQIQFALERGIPAFLAVIGTQKLPFPDNSFDVIHCARCRVHWYADGKYFGTLLYSHVVLLFILLNTALFTYFIHCFNVMCVIFFWLKLLYLGYAGGKPLLELNRVLRPGGYYIWSATPVYRKDPRDIDDWNGL